MNKFWNFAYKLEQLKQEKKKIKKSKKEIMDNGKSDAFKVALHDHHEKKSFKT